MADYGIQCFNAAGQLIFSPTTNAGRILLSVGINASASYTLPGLLDGIPWVGWRYNRMNFPRPFSWSISGNVITLNAPTAGLNAIQAANAINITVGIR